MKIPRSLAVGSALALGALAFTACSSSSNSAATTTTTAVGTIRIGVEGPLTGSQQETGIGMLNGALLAAKQLNAKGGIAGKQIVIVPIDDQANPAVGVAAAKKAIASGLQAVVGPYNSGAGLETLPLYLAAGIVPLRLTSSDQTAGLGFTLQPMTSQIAPVAVHAITTWLGARSVAIVFDSTQDYTNAAHEKMKELLTAAGVTVVADEGIAPGASSYSATVTKILAAKPDLVYIDTYHPEGGLIAKAMFDAKTTSKCLADYGAYDNGFITTAGIDAAQACPVVGVPAPDDFPGAATLVKEYRQEFGSAPGAWSPYTYDSVLVLAAAAQAAGIFAHEPLTNALKAINGWKGWTGTVAFESPSGNRVPAPVTVNRADASGAFHVDSAWINATNFAY